MKVERFVNNAPIEGEMPPLFVKNTVIEGILRVNFLDFRGKDEKKSEKT